MQVNTDIKEAYGVRAQSTKGKLLAVDTVRDKQILDKVSISGKKDARRMTNTAHAASIDKVSLSTELSIDDVNRLLEKEVGRKVKEMFEEAGIEPTAVADTDWSPEATAERIFRGTTGFFDIWKSQNKDMTNEELVDSFEKVLRASVDMGADEAVGLIQGRKFDSEDAIVSTARETVSLVHEKFDTYFESLRADMDDMKESNKEKDIEATSSEQ